ncbi:matrix metalloproteinase-14-like isoform X1 [Onthophagus taurus]|uniref:matrix metalloproteinase-14-like isoform X1 n=2 Tax=Onthophagus taurus TaxID=166361 RepID=UPI0039BE99D3
MKITNIFSIFLVYFSNIFGSKAASLGSNDVMGYLSQYGYVSKGNLMNSSRLLNQSILKRAIEEFQSFAGLPVTGEINEETESVMKLPRCGVKDKFIFGSDTRFKRYALQGSRWKIKNLTYTISKYPTNFDKSEVDNELQKAFTVWSEYTDLTFKQVKTGKVNIEIKFIKGEHGDGDPFDGPGGTLAHSYFPVYGGDIHFDDDEHWTINKHHGTNILQVAAHEIGHALGLLHTDVKQALMAPFYRGYQPYFELHRDDILGIQKLYGNKTTILIDKNNEEDLNINTEDQILCKSSKIDAIFLSTTKGKIYVFKGDQYWSLTDHKIDRGYPKLIANRWPGLPGNIDSAFTHKNGKTYFFKGKKYWKYSGRRMDGDYPKDISAGFPGIPHNIDAVMVWSGNAKTYFFKGDQFWCFDPTQRPPVKNTYPRPISKWKGIPNNLDGAFQYSNGYTYFYKDGVYYRFNDRNFAVDVGNPAFPRSMAYYWFGCQSAPRETIRIS